jgi:hypothetical protein
MNGAQAVHNFGMAPLADGMGLFIATPSYNGEMTFGVTSTREILPDIRFFVECIDESFAELRDLSNPEKPKKKAAAKKPRKKTTRAKTKRKATAKKKTVRKTTAAKKSAK